MSDQNNNDADVAIESPANAVGPSESTGSRPEVPEESRWNRALREITTGNVAISFLAVILALIVGAVMIAATDENVQEAAGYFFARPLDTLAAIWTSVAGAYGAFFRGSIYNVYADDFAAGIRPLTETLTFATPLIAAGLGVALAFRVGMFNIGGRGQMLVASAAAGWVAFAVDLPWGIHMIVALLAGLVAGAAWAGIAGLLKARTGAHEVIVTIMLNYIAFYLISWMLRTPGLLQAPGSSNPKTPAMAETAVFPELLGSSYNLHFGFILALLSVAVVWWILNRSALGFQFE
ncbi:simple sugar transport system permease protein, partial [Microbacterium halimionae]|nr:simple sugar transport system permease protein [Microbacterium halimionae]